jgi:gamma-glutamyltranspeptidase/glutathione hydrolase
VIADDMADTSGIAAASRWPASAKIFRAGGTSLREGDTLVQADLAATLRRSRHCARGF